MKFRTIASLVSASALLIAVTACSDDGDSETEPMTSEEKEPDEGGGSGEGESEEEMDGCPAIEERADVELSGTIDRDTEWTCDKNYYLEDVTYVVGDSTLKIQPGTNVFGDAESALVITRGSKIDAAGTKDEPIVFTSSAAVGERKKEDWGGVVLLGAAKINVDGGENVIEGLPSNDSLGSYGGDDDKHDCGTLRYARIEFAGFPVGSDNEFNGLTVGGCGSDTTLEYIQSHRGGDDGIEFFGGTASIKHALVTAAEDDGFDWDLGYRGNMQFIAVVQDPAGADNGWEVDGQEDNNDATPRTDATVYNFTLVGAGGNGMVLRRGTWNEIGNGIVMNFPKAGLDVRDEASVTAAKNGDLSVESVIFYNNDKGAYAKDDDNDGDFDEEAHFGGDNVEADPELGNPTSLTAPDLVPAAGSPAADGATANPGGWFDAADYLGAFEPGGDDWTEGWTAFPED